MLDLGLASQAPSDRYGHCARWSTRAIPDIAGLPDRDSVKEWLGLPPVRL
jgi:hypothetical protein